MFPTPESNIYRNEDGELIGWDQPAEPDYCEECGSTYYGIYCRCINDLYDDREDQDNE